MAVIAVKLQTARETFKLRGDRCSLYQIYFVDYLTISRAFRRLSTVRKTCEFRKNNNVPGNPIGNF